MFYEEQISLRLQTEVINEIKEHASTAKDIDGFNKYDSTRHFIRCAIQKLLAQERKHAQVQK